MPIRIMLTDDHTLVVNGMRNTLKTYDDLEVVAVYNRGDGLLEGLKKISRDILLLDIQLPDISGIDLLRTVTKKYPAIKVIMLTSLDNIFYVKESMQIGAAGYLTKSTDEETLIAAIRKVYSGETFLAENMKHDLLENIFKANKKANRLAPLTRREKEILKLIVEEKTSHEIGEQLFISTRTVEAHRQSLILKLGVKNAIGLVKAAMQLGLIEQ